MMLLVTWEIVLLYGHKWFFLIIIEEFINGC